MSPTRVLVLRAGEAAAQTAARLVARGYEPVVSPLLRIVDRPVDPGAAHGFQAILVTSANGAARLAVLDPATRATPVLAVGETSADAARAAGFVEVVSADGDARALAALVCARLDPGSGPIAHLRGRDAAGDLAADLARSGFDVRAIVGYAAETNLRLSPEVERGLVERTFRAVLAHSPRSAAAFVAALDAAGLRKTVDRLAAVAISPAALAPLSALPFYDRVAAVRPTEDALLAALDDVLSRCGGAA